MLEYFSSLCRYIEGQTSCDEDWLAWLEAEKSDFCRFNHGLIRQNGQVEKTQIKITLLYKGKKASTVLTLSLVPELDRKQLGVLIKHLRKTLEVLPVDPFFKWSEVPEKSCTTQMKEGGQAGFCCRIAVQDIVDLVQGLDFVGCLMGGWLYRAFSSSRGHHHWFESYSYCLDYSVFHEGYKAVHDQVSGHHWNKETFKSRLETVKERVSLLKQPVKEIEPGNYRVYLSPSAINSLFWRIDFSAKKLHEKDSWLSPLFEEGQHLNNKVTLSLTTVDGSVPSFQQQGFIRPDNLQLIKKGQGCSLVTGPGTAEKYNILFTGGEDKVHMDLVDPPDRLIMDAGTLEEKDICSRIGNGLYISDLWYVNWSEKNSACLTGMTRYACFEVVGGKLGRPIGAMRFDDSLYRIFGENLEELTTHRDTLMETCAFHQRSLGAHLLPGALIGRMKFTS